VSRLLVAVALIGAFFVLPSPTRAATGSPKVAYVTILLKGDPVAQDRAFLVRDGFTHGHLRLDPNLAAARRYAQQLSSFQNEEIAYLRRHGINLSLGYRFHLLVNGFEAAVPVSQLPALRSALNVTAVVPQHRPQLLDDQSFPLVHIPQAWAAINGGGPNAGRGMMIAQIDSGIDIKSPCFSDQGMSAPPIGRRGQLAFTNNKVIVARAFGPDPNKTYSPQDVEGHGTFGASIEACDYGTKTPIGTTASGIAPAAYVMNYNVFPQTSSSDNSGAGQDTLLPAIEAAVQDGADVINMSLGYPWQSVSRLDPDQLMVHAAIAAGVPVSISAGNASEGNNGLLPNSVTTPATAPGAIAVGATTNTRGLQPAVLVGGPTTPPASLQEIRGTQGTNPVTTAVGPSPVSYVGMAREPGDTGNASNADDLSGVDLHGKIALIERGQTTFEDKLNHVAALGAVGAIVMDNVNEVAPLVMIEGTAHIPALSVSKADGTALLAWVQSHPDATLSIDPTLHSFADTPNIVTDFSSAGGFDYQIEPDLVAPGQDIYSATESEVKNNIMYDPSGWTSADGTSFSAPHVTGAIALLLQRFTHLTPPMVATHGSWIKSMLMDTASRTVTLEPNTTSMPAVLQDGAGLLDVAAAIQSTAFLTPGSVSFGEVNSAYGAVSRQSTVAIADAGNGAGTWQVTVKPLDSSGGVTVSAPTSVTLPVNGTASVPISLSVAGGSVTGNADGDIVFSNGTQTIHAPYFVHVVDQAVSAGSVLLVDDTASQFQPLGGAAIRPANVASYYEKALDAIHRPYTYWNEGTLGSPSATEMKRASAVIYFTGNNLNAWASQNSNYEALESPLTGTDVTELDTYLRGGGKVFITGMGAALTDPYFVAGDLGAEAESLSTFDTNTNDPSGKGGVSPPQPSILPDHGDGAFSRVGPFVGLKPIDISTKGNGAHDNLAVDDKLLCQCTVGVSALHALRGANVPNQTSYGQWALAVPQRFGPLDVGITNSAEPTFQHPSPGYLGRSVLFSFGWEGVNDNTGYTTRAQLLGRVFQWFSDTPTVHVTHRTYLAGRAVSLGAVVHTANGAHGAVFQWQIGSTKLKPTVGTTTYTFRRPGRYSVRVLVTDSFGHAALSPWTRVTVRR